ncbi:Alpha-L-arabinofuranosidase 1 [Glycine soja]
MGFEVGGPDNLNVYNWSIVGDGSSISHTSCFKHNKAALQMEVYCGVQKPCPYGDVDISNPGYLGMGDGKWKRVETILEAKATNHYSSLQITTTRNGSYLLDQVSVMPLDTYMCHGFGKDLFQMLVDLKPKFLRFPDIRIISNCDASSKPLNHPADLYDFHTYSSSNDMFSQSTKFDHTLRSGIFVSEYAVKSDAANGNLLAAVAEAAFLIGLEKNNDVVEMVSYAPLFLNINDKRWIPDAIVYGTPSYWVQKLFIESSGATFLDSTLSTKSSNKLVASAILIIWQDSSDKKNYLRIKVVNFGAAAESLHIDINGLDSNCLHPTNVMDENSFLEPKKVVPQTSSLEIADKHLIVILPSYSVISLDFLNPVLQHRNNNVSKLKMKTNIKEIDCAFFIYIIKKCNKLWVDKRLANCCAYANQTSTTLVVDASKSGRQIPDTLFGIFFEEINHAGAGGLWAELVNNRGFEAGGTQVPSNIAPWTIVGQESAILLQTELSSCFERNKVALRMDVLCDNCPSDGVGVSNPGFWGMNIVQGNKYKIVFFVRSEGPLYMTVSFRKTEGGGILASSNIDASESEVSKWKRIETTLVADTSSSNSSLYLTTTKKGVILLDQVSAMPLDTYKGHGFRGDLVNMLLELKPAFFRFPGQTLRNAFRWKDSVGPWEERPGHFGDVWSYWTDEGFGYFEGLQLAEDIGARPLWVFNNGISHTDQVDTSVITPFVKEALDGIEFARGNYLAFYEAIRHAYPDIQMISNCDASSKPLDHPADMYDYHTYPHEAIKMFNNAHVFDKTPRNGPKAFVSEYALIGDIQAKHGTLLGAVSEAGFLIGLERNSDHVIMASYAPLFVNANDRTWSPAAIVYGTPSYWVQFMFRESNGATFLKSQLQTPDPDSVAASAILWKNLQDKKTYLKIKVANVGSNQINFKISLNGFESSNATKATKTVLTSKNALDENSLANPTNIVPKRSPLQSANNEINDILPPVSLTVFDLLKNE